MKRMKWKLAAMAFIALLSACSIPNASEVKRVDALDASAWNVSKWISAVNAPVITGKTGDMENNRAADGASWFVQQGGRKEISHGSFPQETLSRTLFLPAYPRNNSLLP